MLKQVQILTFIYSKMKTERIAQVKIDIFLLAGPLKGGGRILDNPVDVEIGSV